jgi:hypothetical protein
VPHVSLLRHGFAQFQQTPPIIAANAKAANPKVSSLLYALHSTLYTLPYCGIGAGVSVNGFGGAGAFGAVSPGIFGAFETVPAAASVKLIP